MREGRHAPFPTAFALIGLAALLTSCAGQGGSGDGTGTSSAPGSGAPTASASAPGSPSASAVLESVPKNVLLESLVGAGVVKQAKVLQEETYGAGSSKGAGPSFGLELVSGDPSCEQLLAGHDTAVETGAWREIESPDLYLQTFAESFPTVADAITVMDENNAEALNCTTMKVRADGKVLKATHEVTMRAESDGMLMTLEHQIVLDYGGGNVANILMVESRQGGELFTLAMNARTQAGAARGPTVEQKALTRFTAAMKAYRADNPRAEA